MVSSIEESGAYMTDHSELASITGPELVVGLIGPVGADLDLVVESLSAQLVRVGYSVIETRVSALLANVGSYSEFADKTFASDFDRIQTLMDAGSSLRRETARGDALALLSVAEIRRSRVEANKTMHAAWDDERCAKTPLARTAYVLRSLKNPSEIRTLKDVYGRAFFVVSAYAPRNSRVTDLAKQICVSAHDSNHEKYRGQAEELISRDESEGDPLGQNVRYSFPLADLFVELSDRTNVEASISRFVEILFGHPFHTPTRDEFAMFHADATALQSADLSRQVGAAITTDDGQLLAVGCNEVPKYGGGHYWPGDDSDHRDYRTGYDSGVVARVDMVSEIVQRFQEGGLLRGEIEGKNAREAAAHLISGTESAILAGTQVMSVIEYGRSVHAEMAAITDAARRGVSVQGATLYCTTFPCHLCARHIIAAGIKRVVYIEPYPKSLAGKLFQDSMVVDPEGPTGERVTFEAFVGLAPSIYSFMFRSTDERKAADGTAIKWIASDECAPRFRRFVLSYMTIEDLVTGTVIPDTFTGGCEIIGASDEGES